MLRQALLHLSGTDLKSVDQFGRTPFTLAKSRLKFLGANNGYTNDKMRSEIVQVVTVLMP